MNEITIWEPRWHDKVVLIADHKIGTDNRITIEHKDFPVALYVSGKVAKQYPLESMKTKSGGFINVRAVPIRVLESEVLDV